MRTTSAPGDAAQQARTLYAEIDALYEDVRATGGERYREWLPHIARLGFRPSAHNLAAYLAFREHDLRGLQDRLEPLGLSSLGRCEAHVLPALEAVRATLAALGDRDGAPAQRPRRRDFALGDRLLERHTRAIFGPGAMPHIMVTLESAAATDGAFVRRLVDAGMDCARINCAHDDAEIWTAMAANVRRAAAEAERPCRVYVDVAGPKLRVETVASGDPERRFVAGDTVRLTCSEPQVHAALAPGTPVWIDDGKLGATVVTSGADGMVLLIAHAAPKGSKIRPGKGLNFPQTRLPLPALGEKDLADLDWIVANADIVGQSFVRDAADVESLLDELGRRGTVLPVVAKIETAGAIANVPEIIVAGASAVPFGVMIARGDLAVEIGFQRLAEIQEELLWVCEAAHVPVVWATQVLDRFVRKGVPSRSEITDAAMAERAECVMLNKGPFVVEGVAVLSDVLERMRGHQAKKSARLRALGAFRRPAFTTR
jgi:pyruvate kinase